MSKNDGTSDQGDLSDQNEPGEGPPGPTTDLQNLLAAMVEQARALAIRIAGEPDRETQCHFCDAPLPLWENLLVLQLTGVAAQVECPDEALAAKLKQVGPDEGFPYSEFSRAVDRRCDSASLTSCSGTIHQDS